MDFEARFAAKLARLVANLPEFSALVERDPAIKLLEADSFDEQLLAQACNDAARQMLIAFATGGNLDQLGALYGVMRHELPPADPETRAPAVMESAGDLRARHLPPPHSLRDPGAA